MRRDCRGLCKTEPGGEMEMEVTTRQPLPALYRPIGALLSPSHIDFVGEDDRHDHSVNRRRFAENHANQVLGPNARGLHGRSHDARPCEEDTPPSTQHGQTQGERNAHVCPAVGRHMRENLRPAGVAVVIRAEHLFRCRHLCTPVESISGPRLPETQLPVTRKGRA